MVQKEFTSRLNSCSNPYTCMHRILSFAGNPGGIHSSNRSNLRFGFCAYHFHFGITTDSNQLPTLLCDHSDICPIIHPTLPLTKEPLLKLATIPITTPSASFTSESRTTRDLIPVKPRICRQLKN